jgi:hypothetical protein
MEGVGVHAIEVDRYCTESVVWRGWCTVITETIKGICYGHVRSSIPGEVCIQMVPSRGADKVIGEIDRD